MQSRTFSIFLRESILIDGDGLAELLVEHGVGVRKSRTIAVKRIDEDYFADD
ncbi:hypothetical protein [Brevundimonas sp.]|uniref:hypothetical protein n=1 Tax=Brevundimonas sp. TaxID=1871086 RepID=UPI0027315FD2|nr:hypothetical protein [Brevundimonas sp.]MDP1913279.1 hypothetical protein [Brevundimonas sp.]